jgi:hypothetical protein
MKKKIILFTFICCIVTNVHAQGMSWGVSAGISDNISRGTNFSHDGTVGWNIGIFTQIPISKTDNKYVSLETSFSQRGYQSDHIYYSDKDNVQEKWNLGNICLSTNVGMKFNCGENLKILAEAGTYLSYTVTGKTCLYENGSKVASSKEVFRSDGLKRFDLGLEAYAGAQLLSHFQIKIGYQHGLIQQKRNSQFTCYNSALVAKVAYLF